MNCNDNLEFLQVAHMMQMFIKLIWEVSCSISMHINNVQVFHEKKFSKQGIAFCWLVPRFLAAQCSRQKNKQKLVIKNFPMKIKESRDDWETSP